MPTLPTKAKAAPGGNLLKIALAVLAAVAIFVIGLMIGSNRAGVPSTPAEGQQAKSGTQNGPMPATVHYTGIVMDIGKDSMAVLVPGQKSPDGGTAVAKLTLTDKTVVTAKVFAPVVPEVPSAPGNGTAPDAPPKFSDGADAYKELSIAVGDLEKLDMIGFDARIDGQDLVAEKIEWLAHVVKEPKDNEPPELDTTNRFEKSGSGTTVPAPAGTDTTAPPSAAPSAPPPSAAPPAPTTDMPLPPPGGDTTPTP